MSGMRQKGNASGKSYDQIIHGYERFALEQVRGMRDRAAEEVERLKAMETPDSMGRGDEASIWRAEGRLSSWDRALEALDQEFGKPLSKSARKKARQKRAAAAAAAESGDDGGAESA